MNRQPVCLLQNYIRLLWIMALLCACQPTPTPPPPPRAPKVIATIETDRFSVGGEMAINRQTGSIYIVRSSLVTILQGTEKVVDFRTGQAFGDHIVIDEVGNWVYASNSLSNSVTIIQNTRVISNVKTVGREPKAIAIEPKSRWAYVVSGYKLNQVPGQDVVEGNVLVLKGNEVITNINVGRMLLTRVVADPVGGYIYAGGTGGDMVVVKGTEIITRFEGIVIEGLRGTIRAMDANPRTGEVYVLDALGHVRYFKDSKLLDTVRIEKERVGGLNTLHVHPQNGDLYLTDQARNEIVIVRAMKEAVRIPVGRWPIDSAIDSLTGNVYVANLNSNTVTVIHDHKILDTIEVGWRPFHLGINPTNGWVYVANEGDGTVSVLGYR